MDAFTATATEGTFEGAGGVSIFTRTWRPAGAARGAVVIAHGFNSHSGYYGWVAAQLTAAGLGVHALDFRGRGRSGGERFYVDTFSDYVGDLAAFVGLVKSQERQGLPVFLLGHSAGGVVSCLYALDHQAELAGLICESFAFEVPAPAIALDILKGVSHLAPHAHVLALKNADFSRDPAAVKAMNEDPLIAKESQPAETIAEMVRADERLKRSFPRITLPLLILHGTGDKAARPGGSRTFYEAAGSRDKTLKLYDGVFHDPLNDLGKETVMADIVAWLAARLTSR